MNHTAPIPPSIRPMNPMLRCMQLPELTAFSIVLMILIIELVDLIRSRGHYRRSPKKRPVQSRVRHCSGASIIITAGSSMRFYTIQNTLELLQRTKLLYFQWRTEKSFWHLLFRCVNSPQISKLHSRVLQNTEVNLSSRILFEKNILTQISPNWAS